MSLHDLKIPAAGLTSPTSWGSRDSIKKMIKEINANYGKYFKFAAENSKIPEQVLISFCAVESGGNPKAGGTGHVTQGLMQWNRTYAKKQLEDELAAGRMTPAEKDKLAAYGITFDKNGKTREITNADQIKPELNILIGSILLGQLIDEEWGKDIDLEAATAYAKKLVKEDGMFFTDALKKAKEKYYKLRLDRVITVYNAGAYGSDGKKARLGNHPDPKSLASVVNDTTSSYIKKIMGKNGALDVATSDLKTLFA